MSLIIRPPKTSSACVKTLLFLLCLLLLLVSSHVVLDVGLPKIPDKTPLKEKTSEDLDLLKGIA